MKRKMIGIIVQRILKETKKMCCSCGKSIGVHERFIEARSVRHGRWSKTV